MLRAGAGASGCRDKLPAGRDLAEGIEAADQLGVMPGRAGLQAVAPSDEGPLALDRNKTGGRRHRRHSHSQHSVQASDPVVCRVK